MQMHTYINKSRETHTSIQTYMQMYAQIQTEEK